jgi:2-polyprenyl-3-methyl-5-hydroxy-6-metoxy-1,4-benzoquinol methylase
MCICADDKKNDYVNEKAFWDKTYREIDTDRVYLEDGNTFHPLYCPFRKFYYHEMIFYKLIKNIKNKRILSIGGGIDVVALYLAKNGNKVVAIDGSQEAVDKTVLLAKKLNIEKDFTAYQVDWEEYNIAERFEVIITHEALHHMHPAMARISKVLNVLDKGGLLICAEPICLSKLINLFHNKFPFHPSITHFTERDLEFSNEELDYIRRLFKKVTFYYFGLLTRESAFHLLYKVGLRKALRLLGRLDFLLIKFFPFLKHLSSYIIFEAYK